MLTKKHLALFFCLLATPVVAHSWYDPVCCNENDCQPIPVESVRTLPSGYLVTLRPKDHKVLVNETEARSYLVPFKDAKPSGDGEYHACILPWTKEIMRCFYAPVGGV